MILQVSKLLILIVKVSEVKQEELGCMHCLQTRRGLGFLKLILCGSSACVFVCVTAPEAINN